MTKTEKHDLIHLWLHNHDNQIAVLKRSIYGIKDIDNMRILGDSYPNPNAYTVAIAIPKVINHINIERVFLEVPIVKGKSISHTNTIDAVIDVDAICKFELRKLNKDGPILTPAWGNENMYQPYGEGPDFMSFPIKILCEFKPRLESISGLLGQIHVYQLRLREKYQDTTIIPVVITMDSNAAFDQLLSDENIRVIRLTHDIITDRMILVETNFNNNNNNNNNNQSTLQQQQQQQPQAQLSTQQTS